MIEIPGTPSEGLCVEGELFFQAGKRNQIFRYRFPVESYRYCNHPTARLTGDNPGHVEAATAGCACKHNAESVLLHQIPDPATGTIDIEAGIPITRECDIPGFADGQPESPVRLGADLVVQSLHKTLPALTQTALLHRNGERVSSEAVRRFERIYQTSSPSYVMMGSMDSCVRLLEKRGRQIFTEFEERLDRFYERLSGLKTLRVLGQSLPEQGCMKAFDRGKLLISASNGKITGNLLYKELLKRYYLQMEMVCETYVTAILTPWDTQDGLCRLAEALEEIDRELSGPEKPEDGRLFYSGGEAGCGSVMRHWPRTRTVLPLSEAEEAPKTAVRLSGAAGNISGTYVNLYPPGIPLIIPGELITEEIIKLIETYVQQGLNIQGVEKPDGGGFSARELIIETITGRRNRI